MSADKSKDNIVERARIRFPGAMSATLQLNELGARYQAGELAAEIGRRQNVVPCADNHCRGLDLGDIRRPIEFNNCIGSGLRQSPRPESLE